MINEPNYAKDGSIIEAIYDKSVACTSIKMDYNLYYAYEGGSSWSLFGINVSPKDTTDTLSFSSDDPSIVSINEKGLLTPGKVGKTKIHIRCGSQEAVVTFETRAKVIDVKNISFKENNINLQIGQTYNLVPIIEPSDATNKKVTYFPNNPEVADVNSDGVISVHGPGEAGIIVTAENGVSATFRVYVNGGKLTLIMEDNQKLKEASYEKVPYKVLFISYENGNYYNNYVTEFADFKTAYTLALDIDGAGNIYAKGSVYESVNIPFHFEFIDGDGRLYKTEEKHIYIEK